MTWLVAEGQVWGSVYDRIREVEVSLSSPSAIISKKLVKAL